jgi:acetylornithine deacetylase
MNNTEYLYPKAIDLLKQLIAIPSFSKEEQGTAYLLQQWFRKKDIIVQRTGNNIWVKNRFYNEGRPTLLLNSHHDTVRPAKGYTRDPFTAEISEGKLYGLGSNDAGASLVSLAVVFLHFYQEETLPYNLVFAATAEEEISGANGIAALLPLLGAVDCAIVGEPTNMQMAVAERGLMVIDAETRGVSGHAARGEGVNAIYKAMQDIAWIQSHTFEKCSPFLGPVSMQATAIETANKAHNVVPDSCRYTIDVRLNECYAHEEVLDIIRQNVHATITPRSTRLRSTLIDGEHPLVKAGAATGMSSYGSPTLSDKALIPFPALKLGPGESARSHTADEFVYTAEIQEGIDQYISLIVALQHLSNPNI